MSKESADRQIRLFIRDIVNENYKNAHDSLRGILIDKIRERVEKYEKEVGSNKNF